MLIIVFLHLQDVEILLLLIEVIILLAWFGYFYVFLLLDGSRLHLSVSTNWYYNDSYVNYHSSLLQQCELGLGVAMQLVDAVALQGNGLQESIQFREAEDCIERDLF